MYFPGKLKVMVIDNAINSMNDVLEGLQPYGVHIAGVAKFDSAGLKLAAEAEYDVALADDDAGNWSQAKLLADFICKVCNKPLVLLANAGAGHEAPEVREGLVATLYSSASVSDGQLVHKIGINADHLCFFVRRGDVYKRVAWKDVVYLRSEQHYTCLYNASDKQEYLIRASLHKAMQELIPAGMRDNFVQINRAEAVQLNYVTEFSGNELKTPHRTMMLSEGAYRQLKARITCIS
jgi:DNA-binding LytR/AlgR family response regulator